MKFIHLLSSILLLLSPHSSRAQQQTPFNAPGNLNPILPGYFADPTIRKFGDTYYIYATTDGTGNGYGPAQVWVSKDFRNWKNVVLNWPTTEVVWAPDVVQQPDGKFRYYYCEPCMIHVGESDSPLGPWHNILGPDNAVMVPDRYVYNAITLDPQLFRDDDGQEYLYFGTWGIYENFGCGVARLSPEWKAGDGQEKFFLDKKLILNTEIKDFFEAPYVFKKNGIYYFTYSSGSCHDDTYRIQYATASHPMGPYTYKGCILKTNQDGTVHGPGHHSIFQDGEDYYIVYHRHNNPHSLHGFHRQVCIDKVEFDEKGDIKVIQPTHDGPFAQLAAPSKLRKKDLSLQALLTRPELLPNLAYGAKVTASSSYSEDFRPEYAVDDNNATLWRARHTPWDQNGQPQPEYLTIDLGRVQKFNQVWTQFENATFFYQYRIETSTDGQSWIIFSDKTGNTQAGSPMIDVAQAEARYIRITVTDTQKNGHFAAIWNVKVYNATRKNDPRLLLPDTEGMDLAAVEKGYPWLHTLDVTPEQRQALIRQQGIVIDINADDYAENGACNLKAIQNRVGGLFSPDGKEPASGQKAQIRMEAKAGKYAFYFNGSQTLRSNFNLPANLCYNSPYSIEAWVLNPSASALETVVSLSPSRNDLATTELRNGTDRSNGLLAHNASFENSGAPRAIQQGQGQWQHWVISYDGCMERVYLNGQFLQEKAYTFLMVRPGQITLGASSDGNNPFTGYLHSLKVLGRSMSDQEVKAAYNMTSLQPKSSDLSLQPEVRINRLSPDHMSVSILGSDGEALNTGLLSYAFAFQPGDEYSQPTDNASMVLTIPQGAKSLTVRVLDDNGNTVMEKHEKLTADKKKYAVVEQKAVLRLSNDKGEHFNDNPVENGMHVLGEAKGDFILTARFTDIDGRQRRTTPAYNEGGLIMSDGQETVHIGVFPLYDCGNMLTHLSCRGRPQYPNGKAWNYDPWMQLQRIGNEIHARTSVDGIHWVENPGSPVILRGNPVPMKVGLYQTTYNGNKSWVEMDNVKLYIAQ